jgi:GNAT superfamily N-acetyltransferase
VPEFVIRAAGGGDHAAMASIFRRASLANPGDREVLLANPHALRLREDLIRHGRARVAVLADGTVVGFAGTRPTQSGVLELDDIFVDPDWQRRGAARQLMQQIVAEARDAGVVRIDVTGNLHALDFYQATGFVIDGETRTEFGAGLRMHLDVAGPL